jgi:putative FmdB family regulatory protein
LKQRGIQFTAFLACAHAHLRPRRGREQRWPQMSLRFGGGAPTHRARVPGQQACFGGFPASSQAIFLTPAALTSIKIGVMPTYEYVCEKCGHQFEKVQPISAKSLSVCPEDLCAQKRWGKGKVRRAISGGAGVIFKGTGFYITDYRSDKYKEAARKDASSATSGGSTVKSTASETKAAPEKSSGAPAKPKPAKA